MAIRDLGITVRKCRRCGGIVGTARRGGPAPLCGPCVLAEQEEDAAIAANIQQTEREHREMLDAMDEEREAREAERYETWARAENLSYREHATGRWIPRLPGTPA